MSALKVSCDRVILTKFPPPEITLNIANMVEEVPEMQHVLILTMTGFVQPKSDQHSTSYTLHTTISALLSQWLLLFPLLSRLSSSEVQLPHS